MTTESIPTPAQLIAKEMISGLVDRMNNDLRFNSLSMSERLKFFAILASEAVQYALIRYVDTENQNEVLSKVMESIEADTKACIEIFKKALAATKDAEQNGKS